MTARRTTGWLIVVVLGALAAVGWARSTNSSEPTSSAATVAPSAQSGIPAIVSKLSPSVVTIMTSSGLGSGVVWSSDGTIVTAFHVVTGFSQVTVQFEDGKTVDGHVLAGDPVTDLAVLKVDRTGLPAATFAKEPPKVGALAVAIGSPLGFDNTANAGIVSGLGRSFPGGPGPSAAMIDLLQTDADISPGDSGGALIDARGQVIGINEAFIPPSEGAVSIGFATPASTITRIVPQLLKRGKAVHPFHGMQLAELTPDAARQLDVGAGAGVVVLAVVTGGPAANAGLRVGDVITAMDKAWAPTLSAFTAALRSHQPGDVVRLTIVRGATTITTKVTLSEQPS
jgi:serine protease DegQ